MAYTIDRKEFLKITGILAVCGLAIPSILIGCSSPNSDEGQDLIPIVSTEETTKVLKRHLDGWRAGDVDKVMEDWSDDGVLINSSGIIVGKPAIREFYKVVFTEYFPDDDIREAIDFSKQLVEGETAFTEWKGGIAKYASDTVIVRKGKKVAHTFAANYV